jgi:hypothetical protein
LDTILTVGAPAPNRADQVFPHTVRAEMLTSPFKGSIVPA